MLSRDFLARLCLASVLMIALVAVILAIPLWNEWYGL